MQEEKSAIFQMRFPQKLWHLLCQRTDAIMWGGTGRTILLNYRILRNYLQCGQSIFKTTNISSFVRQLNLYGFRKVTSHLQDPLCNSSNPYMHEYVHDFFQFGRPELLNKITRNALTMKRSFKPKNAYNNVEQLLCLTPLQKARQALRLALKKASHEIFLQNSPELSNMKLEFEDFPDELCEEEKSNPAELNWSTSNNVPLPEPSKTAAAPTSVTEHIKVEKTNETGANEATFGNNNQEILMSFAEETSQQNIDAFPGQYLSMPDLATDNTVGPSCDMELLAEFNIQNDVDQGIIQNLSDVNSPSLSVLPLLNHNQIEDEAMTEINEYNEEWDQMFYDIMTNRGSSQEFSSDLKDIYSQISKTIDLLNS